MPDTTSKLSNLSPVARSGVTVVSGLIVGGLVVAVVEGLSVFLFPPPPGMDFSNPEAYGAFMATLPAGAFVLVGAAWMAGAVAGGAVAGWLGGARADVDGGIVGLILAAGSVMNLLNYAHPAWMWAPALLTVPAAWYVARWVSGRRKASAA
ncbi:MAG: hypothetical protein IPG72_02540 [Ardenticatenales bacterium]|nr:hypothetical protein [Ardenticatenales bacterium]